ncbi:hypothetical protein CT676_39060 [Bradyrhizobium sp. MOS001]|uniref:hypothetical protein n=1 Tax=Bradyrhizobium sp. MOS001 TaxID=2133948 RepID=UPI00107582CE|nr:hypothetical protein [Bradyrhizobium sp. MOS001]TFW55743.1 hypothetical protein CT676_39060 [Bradyrhizobium sp. MOS001]
MIAEMRLSAVSVSYFDRQAQCVVNLYIHSLVGDEMGFLRRLFSLERTSIRLAPGRGWIVPVVGESHYQDALRVLHQENGGEDDDAKVAATLVPEDDNALDPDAVRIEVESTTVGYLSQEMALQYREALGERIGACSAKIVGGFERYDGSTAYYGGKLNLAWPPRMN